MATTQETAYVWPALRSAGGATWLQRALSWLALGLAAGLLSACASVRLVDTQVQAFSQLTAPAPTASYRFERLPSQQGESASQAQLESMAEHALAQVGLQRATVTSSVTYIVEIEARAERDDSANPAYGFQDDPFFGMPGHDFLGTRRRHWAWSVPTFPAPYYKRELKLLLRDAASHRVLYETRARHDGPWSDHDKVFPAMLSAALQGFPKPPEGARMVGVEIPR